MGKLASRNANEPESASIGTQEWPSPPTRMKPENRWASNRQAPAGLSGVVGGSARGKISRGAWEAHVNGPFVRRRGHRGTSTCNSWGWSVFRGLCMPEARVFRRAGRGKSASPVRRGDSETQPMAVTHSTTLPARIGVSRLGLQRSAVNRAATFWVCYSGQAGFFDCYAGAAQVRQFHLRVLTREQNPIRTGPQGRRHGVAGAVRTGLTL